MPEVEEIQQATPAPAPQSELPLAPAGGGQTPDPNNEESATPATPEVKPEQQVTPEQAAKREQRRVQNKLEKAYRQRAEARAQAEFLQKQIDELKKGQERPTDAGAPRLENFDDIEKYAEARAKYESDLTVKRLETERQTKTQREQQEQLVESWETKAARADGKYEDFDEVVGDLKPDTYWKLAIMEAENGEDIAYHLGKNPKEAQRINALPPLSQIREIGRLEAKLAAEPQKPKTPSKAPAPITPITGTAAADTGEVRDGMSFKDFVKVRNRQLGRTRTQ
jgi:hypothetical protein